LYRDILYHLLEASCYKTPSFLGIWKLAAPQAYSSLVVQEYLSKNNITMLPQSLCTSVQASVDCYIFPRMGVFLEGYGFQSAEEVEDAMTIALKVTGKGLQEFFWQWHCHW
jgi:hypothetical protein